MLLHIKLYYIRLYYIILFCYRLYCIDYYYLRLYHNILNIYIIIYYITHINFMFIVVSINYQRSLSRLEYDEIHVSHWYTHLVTVHNITPKLLVTYPIEYQPWWILFDRRICNVLIIYQHISYRLRLWWFNIYIYIFIIYIISTKVIYVS